MVIGSTAQVVEIARPEDAASTPDVIYCVRTGSDDALAATPRQIDARGGQAAYDALVAAAQAALARRIGGIVTAPLNKAALWQAGHHYPGHTELLAELCGVAEAEEAMMLYLGPAAFEHRSRARRRACYLTHFAPERV